MSPLNTPVVVNVIQPYSWISSLTSFLQFLAASALAITTYLVTRKDKRTELTTAAVDKTRERKAVWFHKIIVDDALEAIPNFTADSREKLQSCSIELFTKKLQHVPQIQLDDLLSTAITEFSVHLSQVIRRLSSRISVMDTELSSRVEEIGERHETIVTLWMQRLLVAEPFDGRESLPNLLSSLETDLLKALFFYEFERIPVTPPE